MRFPALGLALLVSFEGVAGTIPSGRWTIDPDRSSVRFTVTKFGREVVEGRFHHFEGKVVYDSRLPDRNALQWRVRAASVDTAEPNRDETLRGRSFFDVERHPDLTFVASRIRPLPDGRIHVTGAITIRGVRRHLVITARPVVADRVGPVFESRFVLNRHDFGVSGGSVSRHGISDTVAVHLRLAAVPR